MSVANIVANGSHQTSFRGKYTPAQNISAYAALKFSGIKPGHRVNANTSINTTGKINFPFTDRTITPTKLDFNTKGTPTSAR